MYEKCVVNNEKAMKMMLILDSRWCCTLIEARCCLQLSCMSIYVMHGNSISSSGYNASMMQVEVKVEVGVFQ